MPDISSTFALETYALRSYNYLNRMVDKDGLPYFNIFWTDPAEAVHDWPDYGDVTPRQLQAAVMARRMTGKPTNVESTWYSIVLSYIDAATGLLYRPRTAFCEPVADVADQALTLYALVTLYLDNGDPALERAILKMIDGIRVHLKDMLLFSWPRGFIIESLMVCARYLKSEAALEAARDMLAVLVDSDPIITPDNRIPTGGHMHGTLRTLAGAADYALYVGDPVLYSRVDAAYRFVKSTATSFGFIPELIGRKGDIVSCETCALMDYLGLGVTLANHGHPEYWADIERLVRNHLVESQVTDHSWLVSDNGREDTDQFSWRGIGERMAGGWAGWSSPNHILAARETQHWGGEELHGKTRAFQNCCGGSGTHALFIAWKNASRFENGRLTVNMHIDKLLPQAEIRGHQPYDGRLTISPKQACEIWARVPDFANPSEVKVKVNGRDVELKLAGNYAVFEYADAGDIIEMLYPLPVRNERCTIGNPGFRSYTYDVKWKGDTVIAMTPIGNECATGYSDFDHAQVPIYYGPDSPGRLYQREHLIGSIEPEPAELHEDDGSLNLWKI